MPETPVCCTLPRSRSLRWLTDAGDNVPDEVRLLLISRFFTSVAPLIMGVAGLGSMNIVAVIRHPTTPFFAVLAVDAALLLVRIMILLQTHRATRRGKLNAPDLFLVSGIAWTALVGTATALCVASRDPVLQFLAPTTMMGIVAGLVTRNNCAPRLAILQVALCDVPLQFATPFCGQPWMTVSIAQCPLFLAAMTKTIFGFSRAFLAMAMARRESEERSTRDALTGLWNRSGLMSALARRADDHMAGAQRFALLYIDLDGFKKVNDQLGHAAGDDLLRQAATRISGVIPEPALVARLGGDEFVVVVSAFGASEVVAIGEALIAAVSQPYRLGASESPRIGASVGVAFSGPGQSTDELLAGADAALYRAKGSGKGCCVVADSPEIVRQAGQRAA